jgi:hypothetical protein
MYCTVPANESGWVDVAVSNSGHGNYHAIDTLEVGEGLTVVEQRWIPIVLNQVDKS